MVKELRKGMVLKGEVRLYRGAFKVRVLQKIDGHALVEALEDYDTVKRGERFSTRKMNLWHIVEEATL